MGKTTYIICALNMVASAVALFLIFRSPSKPKFELPLQQNTLAKTVEPPPSPAEIWAQFDQVSTLDAAANLLAKLPVNDAMLGQVAAYVVDHTATGIGGLDFPRIGRIGACVHFLGSHSRWDASHRSLLQSLAKDRHAAVIVRDLALRAVIELALRKHSTKDAADATWRSELATFLTESDFGTDTSIEGLSLQAAVFAQKQGLGTIDPLALTNRLRTILERHASVQETTLIAALEACATVPETNLADAVRTVAASPRSEAVLQAAVATLGKIGNAEDRAWLARMQPVSAALYRTAEVAWTGLTPRM